MARRLRYHFPGAIYHVMLRGNDKQDIFCDDYDRFKFCFLLQEGVERFGHRILAYCFMPNHIHLAIQVADVELSVIMQNLSFRYTQHFNYVHNRVGHLFQGRYKAIVVDGERYLKQLIRYIHLNPVRAGIVSHPLEYRWSSHGCYAGKSNVAWLHREWALRLFGETYESALAQFHDFVQAGVGVEETLDFKRGGADGILGSDTFVEKVREDAEADSRKSVTLSEILDAVCNYYGLDREELADSGKQRSHVRARAMAAFFVRKLNGVNLQELAEFVCKDRSGLSRHAVELEKEGRKCELLRKEMDDIQQRLSQISLTHA